MSRARAFANSALSILVATVACNVEDSVHGIVTANTGAKFDVEIHYSGGATREAATALLATIILTPAREAFPGMDLSRIPDDRTQDEPLDADEPSFAVVLHPLDEAAASERYAWRAIPAFEREVATPQDGVGHAQRGLSVDAATPIYKYLAPGDSWRTSRYRCYAPFGFAASFTGVGQACADMGYESKAGTRCSFGVDPRSPVVIVHDGMPDDIFDWSPSARHWFRGRVTSGLFAGYGTGLVLHAWGVVCL